MKFKFGTLNKVGLFSLALCSLLVAFTQNARALTFNDSNDLGQVWSGIPSGDADRLSYVNHLISMALGSTDTFNGQTFNRSLANPGPGYPNYPAATLIGLVNGTSTTINLGPTPGVYQYLFAKYDGPNGGAEVWYVGNLSGTITIPAVGLYRQKYALSGWTLFGVAGQVPDGGTTLMLLGAGLSALGILRRFLNA